MLLLVTVLAFGLTGPRLSRDSAVIHSRGIASHAAGAKLPLAAEGPVSRILGRDDPSYRVARAPGGFAVNNLRQHLRAWFERRGVLIRSGRAWLGLGVSAYGYGDHLIGVGMVQPTARANRVAYRRRAFDEWYANGPLGLEQGFTFAARPAGGDGALLTLSLAVSGNVGGSISRRADAVTFTGLRVSLSYQGLIVTDARGRQLPAWIELRDRRLLLRIEDGGARYPVRIDPSFVQQAKLIASDGSSGDDLGSSMAISGKTIVVGAPFARVGTNSGQGAAYVFVEPANGWANETQAAKLIASDGSSGDNLGSSVAISGTTIVAGAEGANSGQGAAYVFVEPSSGWGSGTQPQHEQAKLTASDSAANDLFGFSVAVSGTTVVVGASAATLGTTNPGAAYVFVEPQGGWGSGTQPQHEQAKLTASDGAAGDRLGNEVAVSGTTVVAGAPDATVGSNPNQGRAYVFVEPQGGWGSGTQPQHEQAKLTASDGADYDFLGYSVAVSDNTVVAGAPDEGPVCSPEACADSPGAAYVFVEPPSGWGGTQHEQAKLTPSDGIVGDSLGSAVAISGPTIVAGAPFATGGTNFGQGAAYVFLGSATGWANETQAAKLTATNGAANDGLGSSAAISGTTVVAGAPFATVGTNTGQGAAYVFTEATPVNTSLPTISGSPEAGQVLSCSPGTWSNGPTGYVYHWTRDGSDISGATSATYAVQIADAGHQLACVVTAINAAGSSASATSAPVSVAPLGPGTMSNAVGVRFAGRTNQPTGVFVATFQDSDPSAVPSDYVASIDWGDGQTSQGVVDARSTGDFLVSGQHTYQVPVSFPTRITITKVTGAGAPARVIAAGQGDITGTWNGFCPSTFTYRQDGYAPFGVSLYTYPDHIADYNIGPLQIKIELAFDLPDIATCSRGATSSGATGPPSSRSSPVITEPVDVQRPPPLTAGRSTVGFSYGITSHQWLATNQQPWTIYSPSGQAPTATFNPKAEPGLGINLTPFGDSVVALRIAKFPGVTHNAQLVNVAATREFFGTLLTPSASIELSFSGTDLRTLLEQVATQNPQEVVTLASATAAGIAAAATQWSEIPGDLPIELPPGKIIKVDFGGTRIEVPTDFPNKVFDPHILEVNFRQGIDELAAPISPDTALVGGELVGTATEAAADDALVPAFETVVEDIAVLGAAAATDTPTTRAMTAVAARAVLATVPRLSTLAIRSVRIPGPRQLHRALLTLKGLGARLRPLLVMNKARVQIGDLLTTSTVLRPRERLTIVAARLSNRRKHAVSIIVHGPGYDATRLVWALDGIAGANITLPNQMAAGAWTIAIVDYSALRMSRHRQLAGFVDVRLGQFTISRPHKRRKHHPTR